MASKYTIYYQNMTDLQYQKLLYQKNLYRRRRLGQDCTKYLKLIQDIKPLIDEEKIERRRALQEFNLKNRRDDLINDVLPLDVDKTIKNTKFKVVYDN